MVTFNSTLTASTFCLDALNLPPDWVTSLLVGFDIRPLQFMWRREGCQFHHLEERMPRFLRYYVQYAEAQ
jgi:hypothetical protein